MSNGPAALTQSAGDIAQILYDGFVTYRSRFREMTLAARDRFIEQRWMDVQRAARDRILLYHQVKFDVCEAIRERAADLPPGMWRDIKACYRELIETRADIELAATFYNTIFRELGGRENLDETSAFVGNDYVAAGVSEETITRGYSANRLSLVIEQALIETDLGVAFSDLSRDVDRISAKLTKDIPLLRRDLPIELELLQPVFYRNKGAYLVGRLEVEGHVFPLALALAHGGQGIAVDAALWGESRLSVIFSFTRAYFMVEVEGPTAMVNYLSTLLPFKKRWELFTAIGFYKLGKTEFFHDYSAHLARSEDQFVAARGIKGQVMLVFALASYQIVFKVIKDEFPATKSVTREEVREAYTLVKTHDRVGRMADTQEFHHFVFPRARFSAEVLEELTSKAANSVRVMEHHVIVDHLYTERLMTPLNLYINECSPFQLERVLDEYGQAVKQMAAANIFPGDMLLKNFGVTRHGRVVFYDYDEICYLTKINFRDLPQAERTVDRVSTEPWFEVGEFDVFPEEFAHFLFPDEKMRKMFVDMHGDLFTVRTWQDIQEAVFQERLTDVYPYPDTERLI